MILHGIVEALLWYNVLSLGIWFGGTLYQMLVIVPLWSEAPPESVRHFFGQSGYARTINNFFGPRTQALRAIPIFLLAIFGWSDPNWRLWLAVPAMTTALALAMTRLYIYPLNEILIFKAGGDLNADTVVALVRRWIVADRLRFAVMTIGYGALLCGFRMS